MKIFACEFLQFKFLQTTQLFQIWYNLTNERAIYTSSSTFAGAKVDCKRCAHSSTMKFRKWQPFRIWHTKILIRPTKNRARENKLTDNHLIFEAFIKQRLNKKYPLTITSPPNFESSTACVNSYNLLLWRLNVRYACRMRTAYYH